MELVLQQCDVLHNESLFKDEFANNLKNWEIVKNDDECAFIKDGYYWMENTSKSRWMYYKTKLPLKQKEDYLIDTEIEILSKVAYGHVGLVWGFDKEREILNRFTVSADGERLLIMHFQKNHHRVFHRYHSWELKGSSSKKIRLSIARIDGYFYFMVNGKTVYTAHTSQFADNGNYFGYYLEPGVMMRSKYIEAKRLITQPSEAVDSVGKLLDWQPLF